MSNKEIFKNLKNIPQATSVEKKSRDCKDNSVPNGQERDEEPCGACDVRFCDDKLALSWIQCQKCLKWYHNACQGLEEKGPKYFTCISCESDDDK